MCGGSIVSKEDQFRNMSEGDKVWIETHYGWRVEKFSRCTKTLLVTVNKRGNESKYDIITGCEKGNKDRWKMSDTASPFTKQHQERVDNHNRYKRANAALKIIDNFIVNNKGNLDESFVQKLEGLTL